MRDENRLGVSGSSGTVGGRGFWATRHSSRQKGGTGGYRVGEARSKKENWVDCRMWKVNKIKKLG